MPLASGINPTHSAFTTLMLIILFSKILKFSREKPEKKNVSRKVLYIENFVFIGMN
jgi:hypothetical protein